MAKGSGIRDALDRKRFLYCNCSSASQRRHPRHRHHLLPYEGEIFHFLPKRLWWCGLHESRRQHGRPQWRRRLRRNPGNRRQLDVDCGNDASKKGDDRVPRYAFQIASKTMSPLCSKSRRVEGGEERDERKDARWEGGGGAGEVSRLDLIEFLFIDCCCLIAVRGRSKRTDARRCVMKNEKKKRWCKSCKKQSCKVYQSAANLDWCQKRG